MLDTQHKRITPKPHTPMNNNLNNRNKANRCLDALLETLWLIEDKHARIKALERAIRDIEIAIVDVKAEIEAEEFDKNNK